MKLKNKDVFKMNLICNNCGRKIETVSLQCGQSIALNAKTNKWECDMGRCGMVSFDDFLCESCCINSSILKIYHGFQELSEENLEFHEELDLLKSTIIQTILDNPDFKFWVKFGNGEFIYGKGEREGASVYVKSSQNVMSDILTGNTSVFNEFFNGRLKIEGDLQYAVVYFDLLGLALEISNEKEVIVNE